MASGHLDDIFARAAATAPNLYTINSARPFLYDLAALLLDRYAADPAGLADVIIFLPTRRAVRALQDAFLAAAGDAPKATLLPRIRTLGDIGEDDFLGVTDLPGLTDLPPAISPLERKLVLARFIYAKEQWQADDLGAKPSWASALTAAGELAALLDSFYTEQISFEKLQDLVPAHFASHWQVSLKFLDIVASQWPAYLEAQGQLDPSDYRRQLIDGLVSLWDKVQGGTPPDHPLIIAGSTGSMPAVARLMRLVASLPQGAVILPGLDLEMDDAAWQQIEDPHPQAGFRHLLQDWFDNWPRRDVAEWPSVAATPKGTGRQRLISLALRPAEATDDWLRLLDAFSATEDLQQATASLRIAELDDEADEALAIALAMRGVLSDPGKTAILVTPDRVLGRRVSARLHRWGIQLDDSAGVPFANTLRGNFLRLVAAWLEDVANPVNLLTLLKHPLCAVGYSAAELYQLVRQLDLSLRGMRPGEGFDGLRRKLEGGPEWDALEPDTEDPRQAEQQARWRNISPLIDRLEKIASDFQHADDSGHALLQAHIQCAEALATTDEEAGHTRLWAYEDGDAGATLMDSLLGQAALLPQVTKSDWAALFDALIAGTAVRLRGGTNPRLMILGPLEARLQQADLMILGGLNEGVWPDGSAIDPFLSRGMRQQLGLPSLERRIGLSAHDFAQAATAKEVLLTRAKRVSRSPAKPSRWLLRLQNILRAVDLLETADHSPYYHSLIQQIDRPEKVAPAAAPGPCPPVEARPTVFGVTAIEKLMRDPYSIFASRILKLRRLDPLDADLDLAVRGRFYHYLYARFAKDWPKKMPADPARELHQMAEELFERASMSPVLQAFWQAQLTESFNWFINFHGHTLSQGQPAVIEGKGAWQVDIAGREHALTARADRIDKQPDGLFIYDYKTGRVPSQKQGEFFSPQLQLTAIIAAHQGFDKTDDTRTAGYAFVKVLNRRGSAVLGTPDDTVLTGETAQASKEEALDGVLQLLAHYQEASTPYLSQPRAFYKDDYGDYDHLARRAEWAVASGEEGG
jgi:ATP-dependent helicase/nuclease subunit B